jgi:hypothetical protein
MSTIEDQLLALVAGQAEILTAVKAIAAPTVDLTPVLTAVAGVQTTANAILAQDEPTPAAPTPSAAPAAPAA